MYTFTSEEERKASPEVLLNRMLSTKAYGSISRVVEDDSSRFLVSIGEGQCGMIFPLKDNQVIKIPKPAKHQQLWQDATVHKKVREAFRKTPHGLRQDIYVPIYYEWVSSESNIFWNNFSQHFATDTDIKVPSYGLISERILPLPLSIRAAIVDALCSKSIRKQKEAFLKRPQNKDCLVRLYLGRRNDNSKTENVRLRNFPLHVNEMEYLKLDTEMYAVTMARALAVMHWTAGIDANDVEFVLGSSPANDPTAQSLSIWLLDFNQCKEFEHNSQGLEQLVDSFWWNDPYYPRPNDKALWKAFKNVYLEASDELSGGAMAKDFIDAVEKTGAKRSVEFFG
ncbi:hypothetical protein M436DRAFT_67574 [Aureobasidium namibiae CBS 147.97]|uniref:DUF3669 domain-containing protein n=1 Tax=Aureobasidium namibiae CBS 147.97 TaxID=1043004 RepID=A0A074X3J0_9PEZI